jgi:hypothetical protein
MLARTTNLQAKHTTVKKRSTSMLVTAALPVTMKRCVCGFT